MIRNTNSNGKLRTSTPRSYRKYIISPDFGRYHFFHDTHKRHAYPTLDELNGGVCQELSDAIYN